MLKRFRIVGLCVVAVVAITVVGAASASAALPEFKLTGTATFAGVSKTGVKDVLETVKGETVECNKDKSKGEITSGKAGALKKVKVLFEECSGPLGSECGNVSSKNIETNELEGTLVYAASAKSTVLLLLNSVGTRFAKYECLGLFGIKSTFEIRGKRSGEKEGLLGQIPSADLNKVITTFELVFKQSNGVQQFTEYFNGTTQVTGVNLECEASGAVSFAFEQCALQKEDELTFGAGVELKA